MKLKSHLKLVPQTEVDAELVHLRDGAVVLYKRGASKRWQARYKLDDAKWHRISTKQTNPQYAAQIACDAYDRARFLREENLPVATRRFDAVARLAVGEIEQELAAGTGKSVYHSYITAINRYLIPYFGKYNINTIGYEQLKAFDAWRAEQMGKQPVKSTVTTHNSAMNRVFDEAIKRGWLSSAQMPKALNTGAEGRVRETFSKSEYQSLTSYMVGWCKRGHMAKTRQMRELLRDYVLILATTGMRHGTEALGLKWRDIAWVAKKGERYLQITVTGKIGKRQLIAYHQTENYLLRIAQRDENLKDKTFDDILKAKLDLPVFRLASGETTKSLNGTFRHLMRDSGLDKDRDAKSKRTLYSLRHYYAHKVLLEGKFDVYTLATQMGTSVKMIEQHYGHLTATLRADAIAGKRHPKREDATDKKEDEKPTLKN